jgi:putative ABC transport system substrate-binding protein
LRIYWQPDWHGGRVARAQQPGKVYLIAIVHPSRPIKEMSETGSFPFYKALFGELRRLGHIEGQNLIVERNSGEKHWPASSTRNRSPDVISTGNRPGQ